MVKIKATWIFARNLRFNCQTTKMGMIAHAQSVAIHMELKNHVTSARMIGDRHVPFDCHAALKGLHLVVYPTTRTEVATHARKMTPYTHQVKTRLVLHMIRRSRTQMEVLIKAVVME